MGDNDGAIHIWDLKTDKTEQYVSFDSVFKDRIYRPKDQHAEYLFQVLYLVFMHSVLSLY